MNNAADRNLTTLNPIGYANLEVYLNSLMAPVDLPTLAGDYNANGVVDAGDYVVWRNNVDTTNLLANDAIGGTIGSAQYNQWRAHFSESAGSASGISTNAVVPEPATLVLLMFAAAGWCLLRGRPA